MPLSKTSLNIYAIGGHNVKYGRLRGDAPVASKCLSISKPNIALNLVRSTSIAHKVVTLKSLYIS